MIWIFGRPLLWSGAFFILIFSLFWWLLHNTSFLTGHRRSKVQGCHLQWEGKLPLWHNMSFASTIRSSKFGSSSINEIWKIAVFSFPILCTYVNARTQGGRQGSGLFSRLGHIWNSGTGMTYQWRKGIPSAFIWHPGEQNPSRDTSSLCVSLCLDRHT